MFCAGAKTNIALTVFSVPGTKTHYVYCVFCARDKTCITFPAFVLPGTKKHYVYYMFCAGEKNIVFTVVITRTASAFWHHFHPRITKSMDLETVFHLGAPNH